jgi:hypothetical protein
VSHRMDSGGKATSARSATRTRRTPNLFRSYGMRRSSCELVIGGEGVMRKCYFLAKCLSTGFDAENDRSY